MMQVTGNECTPKRSVKIRCNGCRVELVNSGITSPISTLMRVSIEQWNNRHTTKRDVKLEGETPISDFNNAAAGSYDPMERVIPYIVARTLELELTAQKQKADEVEAQIAVMVGALKRAASVICEFQTHGYYPKGVTGEWIDNERMNCHNIISNTPLAAKQMVERLKELELENERLNTQLQIDQWIKGQWKCLKCSFVLSKNILSMRDGNIYANAEPFNQICPNDGTAMKPLTYKDSYLDICKCCEQQVERAVKAEQELATLQSQNTQLKEALMELREELSNKGIVFKYDNGDESFEDFIERNLNPTTKPEQG